MTAALRSNRNREEKFCSITRQATPPQRGGNIQTEEEYHSKPAASMLASDNNTKTTTQWEKDCTKAMTKLTNILHKKITANTKKSNKEQGQSVCTM